MEQNADTGAPMTPTVDNKQKSGKGLKIATAIACIVAVCGIGFGVYGMVQSSQKDNQISDLKNEINILNGKLSLEDGNNGASDEIIDDPSVANNNSKDYIYIGEWGLKLKLPEGLHEVSYNIQNTHENEGPWYSTSGTSMLIIEGWNNAEDAITYSPEAYMNDSCNSAAVVRSPKGQVSGELPSFTMGDYDFHFLGWQSLCPMPETAQTGTLLRDNILNPDNYSKI